MEEQDVIRLNGDGRHLRVFSTTEGTGPASGSTEVQVLGKTVPVRRNEWIERTSEARSALTGTGTTSPHRQISFEKLYPAAEASITHLTRARELLQAASAHLDTALELIRGDDVIHADAQVMEFRSLLPELFLCADQYPGMKVIVVAANYGIQNQQGLPLSEEQIIEIRYAIAQIRAEPFKSFVDAASLVRKMERKGLRVAPEAIDLFIKDAQVHARDAV
jgi:hypothetical protein